MEKTIDLRAYKKAVLTIGFVAASIILPQIFHIFGLGGNVFLPMHIPVLLAGFLLGPTYGLLAGAASPLISTMLTGMPAEFPMMPIMIFELGTYGLVSGLLSKHTKLPSIVALLIAMVAGRVSYAIVYGLIKAFLLPTIGANISAIGAIVTGLPGIAIQIIAITLIMFVVKRKESKVNE